MGTTRLSACTGLILFLFETIHIGGGAGHRRAGRRGGRPRRVRRGRARRWGAPPVDAAIGGAPRGARPAPPIPLVRGGAGPRRPPPLPLGEDEGRGLVCAGPVAHRRS